MSSFSGPEAEGHLSGICTLFVQDGLVDLNHGWPHLFFTKEYGNWDEVRRHILYRRAVITVEVESYRLHSIPRDIVNKAHMLIRLSLPELAQLKRTDSLVVGPDYCCVTFQIGTGLQARPEDYQWDRVCDE